MIETQYIAKVRVLRSDNGGAYHNFDLQKYLEGHGIIHQTTCSNTPQQNGVAERKNRHLLEVVRASLIAAKMSISYWGEAITSATYLINRICIAQKGISMFTILQLDECLLQWIMVFHEDLMYFSFEFELRGEYHKEIQTFDYDYHIFEEDESGQSELVNKEVGEPSSNDHLEAKEEALADPRWKAAMNEEMKSLQKNETWELVECPPGKETTRCRWINTVKYKADGSIERFKARLVAKGYTQTYFDVKNAFLHGELSEEVYIDLPPGCMVLEKQCQKMCKLKKSLYGFKQSLRAWFGRFTKSMRAFGYHQSNLDHTLFLKKQHEFEMKDLGPLKYFLGIEVSDQVKEFFYLKERKIPETCGEINVLSSYKTDLAYALSVWMIGIYIGYFTFVGGNLVTWKSKNKCRHSFKCKAEFRVQHDRTKHVEVDKFFIKEKLDDKIVNCLRFDQKIN
ncbi:Retrovirus-related Pol polyprotein from transposon RE1 [Vitis vinifera]|uniref:Retrovirus-related Pol polyprotein from transposon RE1 n=1 Tax=Vitis vinifera TaxID=29760 RepID=A0A438FX62_VITVI|nr:Retrovirus-related Pol polyprotein from transposon RE1 [Vitis vinifera]